MSTAVVRDLWETIAREAERESSLWGAALRPEAERDHAPVFSPLGEERFALGLETIYEGYLLHYGRPRLFARPDPDTSILLGDYLYAHGLVRIAALGEVRVVVDLAELISLCAQLRAERNAPPAGLRPSPGPGGLDGVVWAATSALLGSADGRLDRARGALRDDGDPTLLAYLAEEQAGSASVARALALHRRRVEPMSDD